MKRGWFDGIGSLMKTVFGTLDSDDAVYYDESIEKAATGKTKLLHSNLNQCFARPRSRVEPTVEMTIQHADYDERSDSPTLETHLRKRKRSTSIESETVALKLKDSACKDSETASELRARATIRATTIATCKLHSRV
ncbi:hypothetical protein EVAR_28596_1 [Eumeta japonica]|uniref:Uncharacterized protein n=1 Tax=Eumeta variegata TaxID=151549 RepID=A0A4C1UWS6_EUMVA|nr:hypothetical protein EVAR_28596_1 [Eumeta japonica]